MTCFDSIDAAFLTNQTLLASAGLFQLAKSAVADDSATLFRVKVAELPTVYVFLLRWDELVTAAAALHVTWPYPLGLNATFQSFSQTWIERTGCVCLLVAAPHAAQLDQRAQRGRQHAGVAAAADRPCIVVCTAAHTNEKATLNTVPACGASATTNSAVQQFQNVTSPAHASARARTTRQHAGLVADDKVLAVGREIKLRP